MQSRPGTGLPSVYVAECRAGKRDGCAVPTAALAGVVREWVDRWDRDHPDLIGSSTSVAGHRIGGGGSERRRNALGQLSGNGAVGAVTILHERTAQVDYYERGVPKKAIRDMLAGRTGGLTELRTADLLVSAIERPDAFQDGTLPVVPNPAASASARADCCGGSLTGTLH
jgi:hypothetical protein